MFRGRLAPLSRFGLQSRGLTGTDSSAGFRRPLGGGAAAPNSILWSKHPKGKNSCPARGGTLADNRPTLFDAKKGQMVIRKLTFLAKTDPVGEPYLVVYSGHSTDLLRPNRPRRGGRAAECGGLLNRCRGQNSYRGFESPPLRHDLSTISVKTCKYSPECIYVYIMPRKPSSLNGGRP
jgi:hypothetical protein